MSKTKAKLLVEHLKLFVFAIIRFDALLKLNNDTRIVEASDKIVELEEKIVNILTNEQD